MRGIGNDIVDLTSIDIARASNPRFYSKILSNTEQQLYHQQFAALPFHQYLWLIWSVKESAYKCLQRHQADLVFTPVKVEIIQLVSPVHPAPAIHRQLVSSGFDQDVYFKSIIQFNDQTLYARSIIYGDVLIHTVALFSDDFGKVQWGVKQIERTDPESLSAEVRSFLLDRIKMLFPGKELAFDKHASGYPFIVDEGLVFSLSHHGRFVGYAF